MEFLRAAFIATIVGVVLVLAVIGAVSVHDAAAQRNWVREHGAITIRGDYYLAPDEFRQHAIPLKGYRVVSADGEKLTVEYFFNCPIELGPGVQFPTFKIPQSSTHSPLMESSNKVPQGKFQ